MQDKCQNYQEIKTYLFPDNWFHHRKSLKNIIYIKAQPKQITNIIAQSLDYINNLELQSRVLVSWFFYVNKDDEIVISCCDYEFDKLKSIIEDTTKQSLKVMDKNKLNKDEEICSILTDQVLQYSFAYTF